MKTFDAYIKTACKKTKDIKKVSDLWNLAIKDTYTVMERKGLIPSQGDTKYVYPAMILYLNRLVYEVLNNGAVNYMDDYEKWTDDDNIEGFLRNSFWGKLSYNLFGLIEKYVFGGNVRLAEDTIIKLFNHNRFDFYNIKFELFKDGRNFQEIALLSEFINAIVNDRTSVWDKYTKPLIYSA